MDGKTSNIPAMAAAGLVMVALCFTAGWLLFAPGHSPAPAQTAPAEAGATLAPTAPTAAPPATRRYNITIETNADWAKAILVEGTFVQGDGATQNAVEVTSEAPEQMARFLYAPSEVATQQKPWATARIVVKGVVETARPTLEVRLGHGDNGTVKIRSPVDSFTNDRVLGDGQNFILGAIRLE